MALLCIMEVVTPFLREVWNNDQRTITHCQKTSAAERDENMLAGNFKETLNQIVPKVSSHNFSGE